ncbi:MAG TPA: HAD family hydrolase [Candidatus Saccharimonadales bacterium]|nr:HAD family hydrolase [Candidatus Saccharimonadales bacterium]
MHISELRGGIFDVDDTLFDNRPPGFTYNIHQESRLAALHATGQKYDLPALLAVTPDQNEIAFRSAPTHSVNGAVWNILTGAGILTGEYDPTHPLIQEIVDLKDELHEAILLEHGIAVTGSPEFVRKYAGHVGAKHLAIGSTAIRRDIDLALQIMELTEFFPAARIISKHDVTHPKPHPEVFNLAFERLQLPMSARRHVPVFEDDPRGIEAGKAAGHPVIAITQRYSREQLGNLAIKPDFIVESFAEAEQLLGM